MRRSASSPRARGVMPTQVMFEGQIEDALGTDPEARSSGAVCGRFRREPVAASNCRCMTISLRSRAIGAPSKSSADCTVFQTFDWLSTWFRNIGVHEGVKPAIVIGRHEGAILFLLPFALEANGFVRKITWLGSYLSNYNGPVVARDFSRRVSAAQFVRDLAAKFNSCCGSSWATT